MSHHYSGPDFSFPQGDARLDMTDLYAFPKPDASGTSILIIDAHPSFGVNPPGPTSTEPFAPGAIYELKIDTNGDAVPDIAYRVQFSEAANGAQTATVRRAEGAEAAGDGFGGAVIVESAPVSTGQQAQITEAGPYRFFAGVRSDPFFFDAGGALNNFQFTGDDFFADKNVSSIAFELPNSALGGGPVALWFRSLIQANGSGWTQADRGARPQQTPFFCPGEEKAAYLAGQPVDDARFVESFAHTLEQAGGYAPEEARRVASGMLPDQLHYDPSKPAAFPDNGRRPTDDAPDVFLSIFTNGKVTTDKVGPHTDLLTEFPYLGPPHRA